MGGKIKRKLIETNSASAYAPQLLICPLCGRPVPDAEKSAHHYVPKSKGGKETAILHKLCHQQIHALFSESELAHQYSTAEALLAHPEMAKFVEWIRKKPNAFNERSRKSQRLRKR